MLYLTLSLGIPRQNDARGENPSAAQLSSQLSYFLPVDLFVFLAPPSPAFRAAALPPRYATGFGLAIL